jgi:hypothetical protein
MSAFLSPGGSVMSIATRCAGPVVGSARRRRVGPAARFPSVRPVLEPLESRLVLDISIRFVGGRPGLQPPAMDPSEVAGAVPDANWNNAIGNFQPVSGPLNDQDGNPVDGTTMGYGGSPGTGAREDDGLPDAPGDSRMMEGYLDTDTTSITVVQVNGLSQFAPYDVYLYFSGDTHDGRHGFYTVVAAGTQTGTDVAPFDGTYTQDVGNGGNYILFTGVTGYQLLVLVSAQSPDNFDNGFRAPLNGIQIVPEAGPHGHHHLAHGLAPSVGGLPGLAATSISSVQPPAPSSPVIGGPQTGGALSAAQVNALFTAPAGHEAPAALGEAGTAAQVDAVFADPIHGAF